MFDRREKTAAEEKPTKKRLKKSIDYYYEGARRSERNDFSIQSEWAEREEVQRAKSTKALIYRKWKEPEAGEANPVWAKWNEIGG